MLKKVLILEPDIKEVANPDFVLWKAQVDPPSDYNSVPLTMLKDNIEVSNRRTLQSWEQLLTDNGYKYDLNYDHKYCREYIIFDTDLITYPLQLLACDISKNSYKVEISSALILPILAFLHLKKEGSVNPVVIHNLINHYYEYYENPKLKYEKEVDDDLYPTIKKILFVIEKLVDQCIDYECDVKYYIDEK
jgi:hypothetical protein